MKKVKIVMILAMALLMALPAVSKEKKKKSKSENHETTTVEWKDKSIGQIENPTWVLQLGWGNDRPFKDAFGIEYTRVCRMGKGSSILLEQAEELSRLDVARKVAEELRQRITAVSGENLSDEQLSQVNGIMKSATVQLSGLREEEQHWKKLRKWDDKAKKFYEEYEFYTAYSISKEAWDEATKRYLLSVMGATGVEKSSQEILGAAYSTLKNSAHREDKAAFDAERKKAREQVARLGESEAAEFEQQTDLEALLK